METIQQQLSVMNTKLETMSQKINVLGQQISLLTTGQASGRPSAPVNGQSSALIIHRDVLEDEDPMIANEAKGKTISQELQMQRLMAQLTAAYNRIAALEEQLLAQRTYEGAQESRSI